jgi:hypothetical protein
VHPADDDIVDDDPLRDDLAEQLAARAPRRLANRLTVVLAGVVLLVGGFVAGAQVQKHFGHPGTAAGVTPSFPAGGRGAFNAGGNPAGGGNATTGNATTGTVKFVDGTTVYITTANGDVVTVRTDGSTSIQLTRAGTVQDLPVGAQVTVTGQAGGDGTVTASKIVKGN